MNLQNLAYDMCRCYLLDQQEWLSEATVKRIFGWIRSRSLSHLCSISDEHALSCVHERRVLRQIPAFFKKNQAFAKPDLLDAQAETAFFKAETNCRITNKRLDHFSAYPHRMDEEVLRVIEVAQRNIYDILGRPSTFLDSLVSRVRVTSGATDARSRLNSRPSMKIDLKEIGVTPACKPYLHLLAKKFGYVIKSRSTLRNRVTTVPKNWKTNRTIACEPEGNLTFQLALDSYIKERLVPFGIDLSDQFKNQRLARIGSQNGSYCTVDLSMASDTVSFNCVAWMLPYEWFHLANTFRVTHGEGFGKTFKYEKFSSMGNGSTFAIETLIFGSICLAVSGKGNFATYGDDLIVPTAQFPLLQKVLKFLGFTINTEKSYVDGPFRESCGADWFNGVNVTPVYLRSKTHGKPELCHVVNAFAALAVPGGELEKYLLQMVEENNLPLVPFNGNSVSGVWLDVTSAYKSGIITTKNSISKYKALVSHTKKIRASSREALFLWHLDAARRDFMKKAPRQFDAYSNVSLELDDASVIIRSLEPTLSHRYRRKWVFWFPPKEAAPIHLYRWSDLLVTSVTRRAGA